MNIKRTIYKTLPPKIRSQIVILREKRRLQAIKPLAQQIKNLKTVNPQWLSEIFSDESLQEEWHKTVAAFSALNVPDHAGGVNPGDQRAVFYLILHLKPSSVLEVGTHIGVSTFFIASSLCFVEKKDIQENKLTTVDIVDVNDPENGPWKSYGSPKPPIELLQSEKLETRVNFMQTQSLDFLKNTRETFDFIFLDGDHSAPTVYKEIPAALEKLNPNGLILLHDFYPEAKPIWGNSVVLPGPYLAMKRIMSENNQINVIPFGNLPWPTKHNSNFSSLALVVKKESSTEQ